jgi:K(+)-stimulated pyrophosphate-energized sodium pump
MSEWLIPASGVLALAIAFAEAGWINTQDPRYQEMVEIGRAVREGAVAFLASE